MVRALFTNDPLQRERLRSIFQLTAGNTDRITIKGGFLRLSREPIDQYFHFVGALMHFFKVLISQTKGYLSEPIQNLQTVYQ